MPYDLRLFLLEIYLLRLHDAASRTCPAVAAFHANAPWHVFVAESRSNGNVVPPYPDGGSFKTSSFALVSWPLGPFHTDDIILASARYLRISSTIDTGHLRAVSCFRYPIMAIHA
jgi:hypothetical protein